jgi:hypothetical protein
VSCLPGRIYVVFVVCMAHCSSLANIRQGGEFAESLTRAGRTVFIPSHFWTSDLTACWLSRRYDILVSMTMTSSPPADTAKPTESQPADTRKPYERPQVGRGRSVQSATLMPSM